MPRAVQVSSESDGEPVPGFTKKTYASKKRRGSSASGSVAVEADKEPHEEPEDTAAEGDEDEDGGEGEEEYEIEKILDAKRGQFSGGRMGYFVKWKNYGDEHNSWVDEQDAGNAQELIDFFWAEKKKGKSGPRKSEPLKSKPKHIEKPQRKSLAHTPDIESSAEPENAAKKRGRPKKEDVPSEPRDEDEDEQRAKKKLRKSNGLARRENKPESEDEEIIGNMKKHMKVPSWEDLIESIDTVERENDGELYVFFTLKSDKKRVRENSRICADKFPQKLITFYESNLRWKTEDSEPLDGE